MTYNLPLCIIKKNIQSIMEEILERIIIDENDSKLELENGLQIIKTKTGKSFNIEIGDNFKYEYCSCSLSSDKRIKGLVDFINKRFISIEEAKKE